MDVVSAAGAGLDVAAPIIVIGNGRSGSSLLMAMLDAHPDIAMLGELSFVVPRLWQTLAELRHTCIEDDLRHRLARRPDVEASLVRRPQQIDEFVREVDAEEARRKGGILRRTLADAMRLPQRNARYWGFKEIWNGSAGDYDWGIYDTVFPQAWWVHIVRDPLQFARSSAWHEGMTDASDEWFAERLRAWFAVFACNRRRTGTGRYVEISYERLAREPRRALAPLFHRLGLAWNDDCEDILTRQFGLRSDRHPAAQRLLPLVAQVSGLQAAMEEFGFCGDEVLPAEDDADTRAHLIGMPGGRWRLTGRFWRETGQAWRYDLSRTALGEELRAVADDVGCWGRSPLRLYEDGRPLAPAHSLHIRIRDAGAGRYSHWQDGLLFSTSDNSDPNRNGRVYSLDVQAAHGIAERTGDRTRATSEAADKGILVAQELE